MTRIRVNTQLNLGKTPLILKCMRIENQSWNLVKQKNKSKSISTISGRKYLVRYVCILPQHWSFNFYYLDQCFILCRVSSLPLFKTASQSKPSAKRLRGAGEKLDRSAIQLVRKHIVTSKKLDTHFILTWWSSVHLIFNLNSLPVNSPYLGG